MLTVGSLFAGIGGFDLGLERTGGFKVAWQVENDPYCNRVLAKHWPHLACWSDVREWTSHGHEPVDLLVGGFPCQDLSVAGKRTGLSGARSGLFWEIVRLAKEIKPSWGLLENVPGLFSSYGGRDMATVLEGLRQCWSVVGYCVLDSQYFGVPQRRRRVFFVCGPAGRSVEEILFESESCGGDSPAGDEEGPDVAASLRGRSHRPGINPPGRGGEDDMNLICDPLTAGSSRGDMIGEERKLIVQAFQPKASSTQSMNLSALAPAMGTTKEIGIVSALTNLGSGGPDDNEAQAGHLVTHSLRAEGFDASEDGTGRGIPIVPISEVGAKTQMGSGRNGCGIGREGDPMFALQAGKQHGVGVRRLTPTECERLQGFPDGWTCLCQSLDSYDPNRCMCPDGPRYKALGNAVTVPVIEWIGRRILASATSRDSTERLELDRRFIRTFPFEDGRYGGI